MSAKNLGAELIGRGFGVAIAIVALALAAEVSQEVNEAKTGAALPNQTPQKMRLARKELKTAPSQQRLVFFIHGKLRRRAVD